MFASADVEVLDFLIAEVFPMFEKSSLTKSARDKKGDGDGTGSSASNTLYGSANASASKGNIVQSSLRRMSLFSSPDKTTLTSMMKKILDDPSYLAAFKTYMIKNCAENLLYAYNDVVEMRERMEHLLRQPLTPRDTGREAGASAAVGVGNTDSSSNEDIYNIALPTKHSPGSAGGQSLKLPLPSAGSGHVSPRVCGSSNASLQTFFHYINNIYDTYLTLGATFRLNIPAKSLDAFHKKLSFCDSVDIEVLRPIEAATLELLIREHLDKFLNTIEYRGLVRGGRGSILVIAKDLKQKVLEPLQKDKDPALQAAETKEATNSYFGGNADEDDDTNGGGDTYGMKKHALDMTNIADDFQSPVIAGAGTGSEGRKLNGGKVSFAVSLNADPPGSGQTLGTDNIITRMELKNFVHSHHNQYFGRYLEEHGNMESVMKFYQSACSYQTARFRNSLEKIAACQSIFDRYISRNSDDLIGLPDTVRTEITTGLLEVSPAVYKRAADMAFEFMHHPHWKAFKSTVYDYTLESMDPHEAAMLETMTEAAATTGSTAATTTSPKAADGAAACAAATGDSTDDDELTSPAASKQAQRRVAIEKRFPAHSEKFAEFASKRYPQLQEPQEGENEGGENDDERRQSSTPFMTTVNVLQGTNANSNGSTTIGAVSMQTNDFGGGSAATSAPSPDGGKSSEKNGESFNLSEILRENCQQHRRRSINHQQDPFQKAAENLTITKNNNVDRIVSGHKENLGPNWKPSAAISRRTSVATPSREEDIYQQQPLGRGGNGAAQSPASSLCAIDPKERRRLLLNILSHPQCCSIFKLYLETLGSTQTLLFILEIEDYLLIPHIQFQRIHARKIFNKYLHPLSVTPVPVPQNTRNSIMSELETAGPGLFKEGYDNVLDYIESCQFGGFLASSEMHEVLTILGAQRTKGQETVSRRRIYFANRGATVTDTTSLRNILQNQISTRFFKDFCHRIFVNESLFFWLDVENYMQLPGTDYMKRNAMKICHKYILDNSKLQINISHVTRNDIIDNVSSPDKFLFKRAQQEIFKLLEQDAMPKFLKGTEYVNMLSCMDAAVSNAGVDSSCNSDGSVSTLFQRALTMLSGNSQ